MNRPLIQRIQTLALALFVLASLLPLGGNAAAQSGGNETAELAGVNFNDVSSTDWYYDAVNFAVEKNLFQGTGANQFSPNTPMSRGMFVTVLGRIAGIDAADYTGTSFSDVSSTSYYAPYVKWAASIGVVSGTGNGKFSPDKGVSRQELTTLLHRYVTYIGGDDFDKNPNSIKNFSDWLSISSYALSPMSWAIEKGILNGSGGKLMPTEGATRAQVAQIFTNAYDILTDGQPAEIKAGTYVCYKDANGVTYESGERPSFKLESGRSFSLSMNSGEGMKAASGTWKSLATESGETYLILTVNSPADWSGDSSYSFSLMENGSLTKEDGSLGITPVESVFELKKSSDSYAYEDDYDPDPGKDPGEDPGGDDDDKPGSGGTRGPGDEGETPKPPEELIPEIWKEYIEYMETTGCGGDPVRNDPEGAKELLGEYLEKLPTTSLSNSNSLRFNGKWICDYYYYPTFAGALRDAAWVHFDLPVNTDIGILTPDQLAEAADCANFITSGSFIGDSANVRMVLGSTVNRTGVYSYRSMLVVDEGPAHYSGNSIVGSWFMTTFTTREVRESNKLAENSSLPALYYDKDECALIAHGANIYSDGSTSDYSYVLFFDLNSKGEVTAEGLLITSTEDRLRNFRRLELVLDLEQSTISS